jgi:VWFA-related protein
MGASPNHGPDLMLRRIALVAFVLSLALPLRGQTPSSALSTDQPVFRAETTLVEVSAIVTSDGVPVTDLTADEVQVFDEGRRQPLVSFEFVDLTTTEGPPQGRDFVLVLDDRHIAPKHTRPTRDVALAFIRALGPHDRLAIVNTGSTELVQQLSTDRPAAEALVRRVRGEQPGFRMPIEAELYARITFDVLRNVAKVVQREGTGERRAVVLVSEGHSVFPEGPQGDQYAELRTAYMDMLREASLANVAVYSIDPRGLMVSGPGGATRPADPRATGSPDLTTSFSALGNQLPTTTAEAVAAALAARRFGSLGRLASYTGGVLTVDTNDLGKDIPRILQDSRQYYRLVYAQPDAEPGRVHPATRRIQVKVARAGVQVRARQQYVPVSEPR